MERESLLPGSGIYNPVFFNRKMKEDPRFHDMRMFMHHIYEFKKGVRNLILCTMTNTCAQFVIRRLEQQQIAYLEQKVTDNKINLYFGKKACLDAVRTFINKPLNLLTPEEDFILGAMLGYDITMQCERFCNKKGLEVVV